MQLKRVGDRWTGRKQTFWVRGANTLEQINNCGYFRVFISGVCVCVATGHWLGTNASAAAPPPLPHYLLIVVANCQAT